MMMRRKIKTVAESSLVTNENESNSINNQVVFQRGLKTSTTSSLQEHFNNHFGKVTIIAITFIQIHPASPSPI